MQEFSKMRREARAIRDDAIAAAKTAYEQRINEIASLQAYSNGRRRRAIPGMMTNALPQEPFTLDELVAALKAKHPTTIWTTRVARFSPRATLRARRDERR